MKSMTTLFDLALFTTTPEGEFIAEVSELQVDRMPATFTIGGIAKPFTFVREILGPDCLDPQEPREVQGWVFANADAQTATVFND